MIRLDGSGPRSLAPNPDPYGAQYRPVFSPDGARIAFAHADGSLATVAAAGGAVARLTSPPPRRGARGDREPLYSPDGAWIAFTRAPLSGMADVHVVRVDGTGLRRLTTTPTPPRGTPRVGSSALAWSPDGTSLLAFRHDRFALVDVASGRSTPGRRTGVQYGVGPAVWR